MTENIYCYYLNDVSSLSRLLVSYDSLMKTNPKYDVCCLLGLLAQKEKIINFIKEIGMFPLKNNRELSEIIYDGNDISSVFCCSGKLEILRYQQYNKVVMLDADTLIKSNIDDLFNYPSGSMADHLSYSRPNAGIVVLEPNKEIENAFLKCIDDGRKNGKFKYAFDQEFLEDYYDYANRTELHIENRYNMLISVMTQLNVSFDISDIKILHFNGCGENMEDRSEQELNNYYNKYSVKLIIDYLNYFDDVINKYKEKHPYLPIVNTVYNSCKEYSNG